MTSFNSLLPKSFHSLLFSCEVCSMTNNRKLTLSTAKARIHLSIFLQARGYGIYCKIRILPLSHITPKNDYYLIFVHPPPQIECLEWAKNAFSIGWMCFFKNENSVFKIESHIRNPSHITSSSFVLKFNNANPYPTIPWKSRCQDQEAAPPSPSCYIKPEDFFIDNLSVLWFVRSGVLVGPHTRLNPWPRKSQRPPAWITVQIFGPDKPESSITTYWARREFRLYASNTQSTYMPPTC